MKKSLFFIFLIFLSVAIFSQGITYKGNLKIEPPDVEGEKEAKSPNLTGFEFESFASGGKFKMVYLTDFGFFKNGDYMLGDANAKVVYFVFPGTKSYWEMNLDDYAKFGQETQKLVKLTYSNQNVSVSLLPPKVINGYPCTGKRVKISYDMESSTLGIKNRTHKEETTDYYSTTKYDVLALFGGYNWHSEGVKTGDPIFDKQISEKIGFLGFPIQIISENYSNGKYEGKTILTTRDVSVSKVSPAVFILPSGYTKEESGIWSTINRALTSENSSEESTEASKEENKDGESAEENKENENKEDNSIQNKGKKIFKKIIKKVTK